MSADAIGLNSTSPSSETADFSLSPEEVSRGEAAASAYIESLKPGEGRASAEEALDTLAAVISGGVCAGLRFPWQQVRAYHSALALSIVKEEGAPGHLETLRCRHDETRRFQQVPDSFAPKQIQRMRISLKGVITQCRDLGYITDDDFQRAMSPGGSSAKRPSRERRLGDGEIRALLSACDMDSSIRGPRDALMICLAYQGRLRTVDLINLTLDDLHFDNKTGNVTLRVRQPQGKRSRRVPLENEDLIALEDWLEIRGRGEGPLFCRLTRGRQQDTKRMTAADVRDLCEQRASQSGVDAFAPNDLAKSSPSQRENGRRKRSSRAQQRQRTQPGSVSPLYEDGAQEDHDTEKIHFPYRVRTGV